MALGAVASRLNFLDGKNLGAVRQQHESALKCWLDPVIGTRDRQCSQKGRSGKRQTISERVGATERWQDHAIEQNLDSLCMVRRQFQIVAVRHQHQFLRLHGLAPAIVLALAGDLHLNGLQRSNDHPRVNVFRFVDVGAVAALGQESGKDVDRTLLLSSVRFRPFLRCRRERPAVGFLDRRQLTAELSSAGAMAPFSVVGSSDDVA